MPKTLAALRTLLKSREGRIKSETILEQIMGSPHPTKIFEGLPFGPAYRVHATMPRKNAENFEAELKALESRLKLAKGSLVYEKMGYVANPSALKLSDDMLVVVKYFFKQKRKGELDRQRKLADKKIN